jgi:hypothetical protein
MLNYGVGRPDRPVPTEVNPEPQELRRPRLRQHHTVPKWNYPVVPNV